MTLPSFTKALSLIKCLAVLGSLTLMTHYAHAEQHHGITVTGKAAIEKTPDQFHVVFTFEQRTKVVNKAKTKIDHQVSLLTKAANKLDVADKQITTTNLQVVPIYPKSEHNLHRAYVEQELGNAKGAVSVDLDNDNKANKLVFDIRRQVEVNLTDINDYEYLLDTALKIGASRISPVQTSIANAEAVYQQALSQAVTNAKNKAQQLAKSLGVTLGEVTMLNEHAYRAPGKVMMMAESFDMKTRGQSFAGTDKISAEVTVTFSLKN